MKGRKIIPTTKEKVDKLCDCKKCDKADCKYRNKRKRLPSEFYLNAQGLCPNLWNERY